MASYHEKNEASDSGGVPSLEDLECGKLVGAILPMSDKAQGALRDSIEIIDFLLNQEGVTWS